MIFNSEYSIFYLHFTNLVDIIISTMVKPPQQTMIDLASRARKIRLAANLTQVGLEQRSGVGLGSIKAFERTGKISIESLVKIGIALGASDGFEKLFASDEIESRSIDELLREANPGQQRQRGRIT